MPVENLPDLPSMAFDLISQHISPDASWIPLIVTGIIGLAGLLFMIKGARLAPILAAAVFAVVGGVAGSTLTGVVALPLWLAVGAGGVVGLVLGIVLFKFWLAALVGVCLIIAGLGVYSGQVLRGPLQEYLAAGLDRQQQLVTLPTAGDGVAEPASWQAEVAGAWTHLSRHVPNFQPSIFAIVASTGLAGLVFGLLLPKVARAFWAASFGTILLLVAVQALVQTYWPAAAAWMAQWGLWVVGVPWCASLVYNLADIHERPRKTAPAEEKKATA